MAVAACKPSPDDDACFSLLADPAVVNFVQPFDVYVDSTHRRVWGTALGTASLAEIDADTFVAGETIRLGETALERPQVIADVAGVAWIGSTSAPSLYRWDPTLDDLTTSTPLDTVSALVPRPGGGLVAFGLLNSVHTLALIDADGTVGITQPVPGAGGIAPLADGLLLLGEAGEVRGWDDLALVRTCPLPFEAQNGAGLADGGVVVTDDDRIGYSDCTTTLQWDVGVEAKEIAPYADGALVLDRIGPEDPNLGMAWMVTSAGVTPDFQTAKNTGFGGIDPVTGLLWGNSEGTAEITAFDPGSGAEVVADKLGTFVDGIAPDPDEPGVMIATGRLSDTVERVVDGVVTARTDLVHWPYSPAIDDTRGMVWMVRQTDGTIIGLDATTLGPITEIDLGFAPNPLLTFSTLTYDRSRDLLYLAESYSDTLVLVDPGNRAEIARWSLGGPVITDPDAIGELTVRVDSSSGYVLVGRTNDGRIVRVDPVSGEVVTTDFTANSPSERQIDSLHTFPEHGVFFMGGHGFDTRTLAPEVTIPASDVIATEPRDDWLAVSPDQQELQRLDADGKVKAALNIADKTLNAMIVDITFDLKTLLVGHADDATICRYPTSDVR